MEGVSELLPRKDVMKECCVSLKFCCMASDSESHAECYEYLSVTSRQVLQSVARKRDFVCNTGNFIRCSFRKLLNTASMISRDCRFHVNQY